MSNSKIKKTEKPAPNFEAFGSEFVELPANTCVSFNQPGMSDEYARNHPFIKLNDKFVLIDDGSKLTFYPFSFVKKIVVHKQL